MAKPDHIVLVIAGYEIQHTNDTHKIIREVIVPSKAGWTMSRLEKVLDDIQFHRMVTDDDRMP